MVCGSFCTRLQAMPAFEKHRRSTIRRGACSSSPRARIATRTSMAPQAFLITRKTMDMDTLRPGWLATRSTASRPDHDSVQPDTPASLGAVQCEHQ